MRKIYLLVSFSLSSKAHIDIYKETKIVLLHRVTGNKIGQNVLGPQKAKLAKKKCLKKVFIDIFNIKL